jgi:hypothetical protein
VRLALAVATIPELEVLGVEAVASGRGGRGRYDKANTGYYSAAEWKKLSYEERDKIRKERDKKGEQGGSKRNISELSTKQLTTALISSLQKVSASDNSSETTVETPKQSNQAGNVFGGREGAKRQKNSE